MSRVGDGDLHRAERAVDRAIRAGADEAAVSVSTGRQLRIEHREGRPEGLFESVRRTLTIRVFRAGRYSSHVTSDLREEQVETFIDAAVAATRYLAEDPHRRLPDPGWYPEGDPPDLALRDPEAEDRTVEEKIARAAEIEAAARGSEGPILTVSAHYADHLSDSVRVHSNGFSGRLSASAFSESAEVGVRDGDRGRPQGGFGASVRRYADLPDPETVGREAARRAIERIGQQTGPSGRYPLVVENRVAPRLLGTLLGATSGRAVQQRASYLEGMIGERIGSPVLTLEDDPLRVGWLGSRPFDGEGLAARPRRIIDAGVLRHYYLNTYYARKLEMAPTSGTPSNLIIPPGERSLEEMVRDLGRGILVTGFLGGNVNATTGDFSLGIIGHRIERGERAGPINEMNIAGNAINLWQSLVETGNDPYPYAASRTPSLRFSEAELSGS